jgi:hypothetical protein
MIQKLSLIFRYGLDKPTSLIELWLRTLMSLACWNTNKNVLYLVDLLCKEAFVQPEIRSKIKTIFSEFLEVSQKLSISI